MGKKISLLLIIMLFALVFLGAEDHDQENTPGQGPSKPTFAIDLGQEQLEDSLGGLLEGTATSDGFFSVSYSPDFSFNKLSFQLALNLEGQFTINPSGLTLDLSRWTLPPREENQSRSDYILASLLQYSSFIRYVQWGDRNENMYIRYGKLAGITLGDGALLNGFFDRGVEHTITRPGLNITLDGSLMRMPNTGFEFVINDLFDPTLMAWRVFARPLKIQYPTSYFSNLEVGVSFAENPSVSFVSDEDDAPHTRKLIALDMNIPLLTYDTFTLAFFSDILVQTPGVSSPQPALATRYGLFGYSKSFFLFNASVTFPTFGAYYPDYFDSGFEFLTLEDRTNSILRAGSMRIDAMTGLNFTRLGAYVKARVRGDYSNGIFSNQTFQANVRIDKRLLNIVSLDLSYEKLYPITSDEGFIDGLFTLCNVEIAASTIIKIKPYAFTIRLSMIFDEFAQSTLQVDTAVRISIL